jgi:hypothetical protein
MRQIKFSLLVLTTVLATSLSIHADRVSAQQAPPQVDLIGVGAQLLNGLLNPPSRTAEINGETEVKKAKIAADAEIEKEKLRIEASKTADKVTPVLNQWNVARVPCGSGVVVINIGNDTVCTQPDAKTPAGYYTYDSAKQKLVRSGNSAPSGSTAHGSSTTQNSSNPSNNTNVQTTQTTQNNGQVKTTQTTRVTGSGQHDGF